MASKRFHKNEMRSLIKASFTIFDSLFSSNSRIVSRRPQLLYPVMSVKIEDYVPILNFWPSTDL